MISSPDAEARPNPNQWLYIDDAAHTIGVSRQYVNKLIKEGRIPGRFYQYRAGGFGIWEVRRWDLDWYVATRKWNRKDKPLPDGYVTSLSPQELETAARSGRPRRSGRGGSTRGFTLAFAC